MSEDRHLYYAYIFVLKKQLQEKIPSRLLFISQDIIKLMIAMISPEFVSQISHGTYYDMNKKLA